MHSITRSILESTLQADGDLAETERTVLRQLIDGTFVAAETSVCRLLSQAEAAKTLAVNRVTIWRMVQKQFLHPVEILPGEFRYPLTELELLASRGWRATLAHTNENAGRYRHLQAQ